MTMRRLHAGYQLSDHTSLNDVYLLFLGGFLNSKRHFNEFVSLVFFLCFTDTNPCFFSLGPCGVTIKNFANDRNG